MPEPEINFANVKPPFQVQPGGSIRALIQTLREADAAGAGVILPDGTHIARAKLSAAIDVAEACHECARTPMQKAAGVRISAIAQARGGKWGGALSPTYRGKARLSPEQRAEITALASKGSSRRSLSKQFGVSMGTIARVLARME